MTRSTELHECYISIRGAPRWAPQGGPISQYFRHFQISFESKLVEILWGRAQMHLKSNLYISLPAENKVFTFLGIFRLVKKLCFLWFRMVLNIFDRFECY